MMAISNSTQKPLSILLGIYITSFLLLLNQAVCSSESLSFTIPKFDACYTKSITLQGNAQISPIGVLQLTDRKNPTWNTGRVLYGTPFRLWDAKTGDLASFHTSFSFVVEDFAGSAPADGLAFFIAPPESKIPSNSQGDLLGIIDGKTALNQVVAVEFDSYKNDYDPAYPHVGIDVNSIRSLVTVKWERKSGSVVTADIIYDSISKTLTAVLTYPDAQISTVSQVIDLRAVLPESVSIGLSATTTGVIEAHDIHSWSFHSTLQRSNAKADISIAYA